MQFQVVFAIVVSAMVCSAQFVPPPPVGPVGPLGPVGVPGLPILPPLIPPFLFPGLGFRPFFGLRRFGLFGGLGFPFGPFGGLGLGLGPLGLLGKRDTEAVENLEGEKKVNEKSVEKVNEVDDMKVESQKQVVEKSIESKVVEKSVEQKVVEKSIAEPRTLCSLSTEDNRLRCNGANVTFECAVRPQISQLGSIKLRIADLVFRQSSDVIELVGRESRITAVSPVDKSDILISLFNGEHARLTGFEVEQRQCWEQVERLVREVVPENLRVSLFVQA